MAGMSRDKCGAAATAGLMKTIAELQPKGVKIVAALCMVRNSVGANAYVSDEIFTSSWGEDQDWEHGCRGKNGNGRCSM